MSSPSTIVPVLGGGRLVLFPGMRCQVHLRSAQSQAALVAAAERDGSVAVFASRFEAERGIGVDHFHGVGALARVRNLGRSTCCGRPAAELEGIARVCVDEWTRLDPFREARCSILAEPMADAKAHRLAFEVSALSIRLRGLFPRCVHRSDAAERVALATTPGAVLGAVATLFLDLPTFERQQLLELDSLAECLEHVLCVLLERLARAAHSVAREEGGPTGPRLVRG